MEATIKDIEQMKEELIDKVNEINIAQTKDIVEDSLSNRKIMFILSDIRNQVKKISNYVGEIYDRDNKLRILFRGASLRIKESHIEGKYMLLLKDYKSSETIVNLKLCDSLDEAKRLEAEMLDLEMKNKREYYETCYYIYKVRRKEAIEESYLDEAKWARQANEHQLHLEETISPNVSKIMSKILKEA